MKRFTSLAAAITLAFTSLFAAKTYDLGEVELGKVYTIPASAEFGTITGTLTPTASGALSMTGINGAIELYTDESHSDASRLPGEWVAGSFGANWTAIFQVEANTTYYLYAGWFSLDSGNTVIFQMVDDVEIALEETYPKAGEPVSTLTNSNGDIILVFNTGVTYDNAYIEAAGTKAQAGTGIIDPTRQVAINVKSALNTLFASGALSADGGDTFSLCVEGIKANDNNQYGEDGTLQINFINAGKLADIASTNLGSNPTIKSYYPVGDPNGILEFVFDKNLKASDGTFTLMIGNMEIEGAFYTEQLPAVVDGNKVTVDLTGKLRDLNAYSKYQAQAIPGTDGIVAGVLASLYDEKGNVVAGSGQGSYGSYTFNFIYDYIVPANIACEFTPATGQSLEGVDEIEIWFNNADVLTFDGVNFRYNDAGTMKDVVVPIDKLNIEKLTNEYTIICAVPEEVKGKKSITVTLSNLVSLDGYDHTNDIRALYDQFVATLIAPIKDGERIAYTGDADFVVTVNKTVNYMRYDFYNGDEWYYGTDFHLQSDGTYTSFNNNYPCYSDVDNRMLIRVYDSEADYWNERPCTDSYEFHFIGTIAPFVYSSYNFVSIDPAPNTVITQTTDFCFTLTFDGFARIEESRSGIILGMGMGLQDFEKIEPVEPEEINGKAFANVWKLYPGDSYMESHSGIDISVAAYDQDEFLIQGNKIEGSELDYLQFSYVIESATSFANVTVTPAAGEVEALDTFTVKCNGKAVGINYNCTLFPSIEAEDGSWAYYFISDDMEVVSDQTGEDDLGNPEYSEITVVEMTLPEAIADKGVYTLEIPEKVFMIGSQFDTAYNKALTLVYTILGGDSISSILVETAPVYDVYTLSGIRVMRTTSAAELCTLHRGIYIINGKKVIMK